jgi:hypothetical protein
MGYDMVLIVKDVSEFIGIDGRTYRLHAQEVVSLPEIHAKNLIVSGYAREICSSGKSVDEQDKAKDQHFAELAAKHTRSGESQAQAQAT